MYMVHVRNTSVEALELKTDRTSQTHRIKTIAPARKKIIRNSKAILF